MDEVEVVSFVLPFAFEVLHDELDVRGYPDRLDRADVIPNDVGAGEFPIVWGLVLPYIKMDDEGFHILGNVHSPNARSRS